METESDGNEEVETNNLNSSCALTILNKSSLNNSMELDNEVFYDVYECDQNLNIEEATLNFLKNINHPFLLKSEDLLFEEKRNHIFRRVRITVKRNNNRNFMEKVEKRKGMDWEENEEVFLHKVKKLKV